MIDLKAREDSNARWVNMRIKPSVTPNPDRKYSPTSRASSNGPIARFQSSTIATISPTSGSGTPIRLTILLVRLMLVQGYVQVIQVSQPDSTTGGDELVHLI